MTSYKTSLIAAIASLAIIAGGTAAMAAPATANVALNLRTGPGTNFNIIDTLQAGEPVNVTECVSNNWCYVERPGPDGWVSANYLTAVNPPAPPPPPAPTPPPPPPPSPSDPNCSFGIVVGPDGPTFSLNCGDTPTPPPPAPPPPPPAPVADKACFYTGNNYSGAKLCYSPAVLNSLPGVLNNRISSVRLYGNAKARICTSTSLAGICSTINVSRPNLNAALNNRISSLKVFTGILPPPPPPPAPVTFSTGPISLQQTFSANLDNGNVGAGGADIWYRAVNALQKFIVPINGARIALGDGSNRGFNGCSVASYSNSPVSIWDMPVGTYVCVKTNQGRISQFRLNGYNGTTMNLGYTTWAN